MSQDATDHLMGLYPQTDLTADDRLMYYKLGLPSAPRCPVCDGKRNRYGSRIARTCSRTCAEIHLKQTGRLEERTQKQAATLMKRYGVIGTRSVPGAKDKYTATSLANYGVEHPSQSTIVRDRVTATNLERYGVPSPMQVQVVKDKVRETMMERYGAPYTANVPELMVKKLATMVERYGVEHSAQSDVIMDKIVASNRERYGVDNVFQSEVIKDKIRQTNVEKYGVDSVNQRNIKNLDEWLDDSRFTELFDQLTMPALMEYFGVGKDIVYLRSRRLGIRDLSRSQPEADIASLFAGHEVILNSRKVIPPLELDIYVPALALAVEYCGLYWHSNTKGKSAQYHETKMRMCNERSIRLITIFEDEWLTHPDDCSRRIMGIINGSEPRPSGSVMLNLRWSVVPTGHTVTRRLPPVRWYTDCNTRRLEQSASFRHIIYDCGHVVCQQS